MKCIILLLLLGIVTVHSLNILAIMPLHGRSHYFPFLSLATGLAEKGHKVTIMTPFAAKSVVPNLEQIVLDGPKLTGEMMGFDEMEKFFGAESVTQLSFKVLQVFVFQNASQMSCDTYLNSKASKAFFKEKRHYDLVITEAFHTDCWVPFAFKFNAPLVHFTASVPMPWFNNRFGQPNNPAYLPNMMAGFVAPMGFVERMQNMIIDAFHRFYFDYIQEPTNDEFAKQYFGEFMPSRDELEKRGTLLLTNSHYSLTGARPYVPGIVEVGGIHVTKGPQKLPLNIEKWINESKDGVIYFSMGSMIKGHTFPEEKRKMFLRAFGRLKQRVLWKWENETMPFKPDNVMIQKWMPQFDILCHPNVKAFIAHGGLLGTTEAVHCGVPVVVMPQFGDQHTNAKALEAGGGGVILNFREADEEMVYNALKTVLDPEFNKKAKELSARFRDRPMSPMDTAIYWIEYVARHKGAHHMRTAAVGMPLYQYLLLDVFAFLGICLLTFMIVTIYITKLFWRLLTSLFSSGDKKQKVKKN